VQLRIILSLRDGDIEVSTTPFVVMAWERQYKTKMSAVFDTGLGMEDLLYLGWEGSKAAGITVKPFDQWAKEVKEVRLAGSESVPTSAAASDGS